MRSSFVVGATVMALAGSLAAADQRGQATARQRFAQMDQNGDGQISRAEWRGSDQSFRVHDWNRDGVLSGDEVRAAVRQSAQPGAGEPGDFSDVYNDWSESRFTAIDRNRNGRIDRGEWIYDVDTFVRVDRNRDGALSRQEFLGGDFDDDRADRFDYLDMDGNNRVTRDEWHASDEAFNWLDTNGDGRLTRREVEGDNATDRELFDGLDTNGDGRVSRTEWQWSRASFDQRDTNRDGILTRREMAGTSADTNTASATVDVMGTTRWTDTGLQVLAGDQVRFQASGSIQMSSNTADVADPRGSRTNRLASEAPLPTVPAGALIARVNQGPPFEVGQAGAVRMTRSGRLFLGSNDDHLADNSGAFRVVVTIQRAAR